MAEKGHLRLILADDSAETREYLRKLLSFEADIELVGMAKNGQEAVALARETQPDVILMDINMPVMDGLEAVKIICREIPTARVVMMSVQQDRPYLRRAMQAGAREYLSKPFTYDDLIGILNRVREVQPVAVRPAAQAVPQMVAAPVKLATLVVVFSPRGGAGCSTVALNLAFILRGQRQANVLLIDGNLRFGALDALLNLQTSRNITDLIPSLDDDDPDVLHAATLPHTSGLRLLAAPPSPEMADLLSSQHMEKIIALGRRRFDYVVADLGSQLNDYTLLFMDAATRIILLLTPDIPATKNARLFLEIASSLDYEPEKIILALNQADPREMINAAAIERHLKHPVAISIPSRPQLARAAINRGVPLALYERQVDKNIPITRQLLALTKMLPEPDFALDRTGKTPEAEPAPRSPTVGRAPEPKKQRRFGGLFRRGN
ncbi:MAG: response regulator [Anaerolineae bacterium]|jgi:pilus assembly protein CpaE